MSTGEIDEILTNAEVETRKLKRMIDKRAEVEERDFNSSRIGNLAEAAHGYHHGHHHGHGSRSSSRSPSCHSCDPGKLS